MREKISVIGVKRLGDDEFLLQVDHEVSLDAIKPAGQMLVDSDELAFVYLLEKNNDYTYVLIKEETWTELGKAVMSKSRVYLDNGVEKMELVDFIDELSYLIENIKGNSNYGEAMVAKVEAIF